MIIKAVFRKNGIEEEREISAHVVREGDRDVIAGEPNPDFAGPFWAGNTAIYQGDIMRVLDRYVG